MQWECTWVNFLTSDLVSHRHPILISEGILRFVLKTHDILAPEQGGQQITTVNNHECARNQTYFLWKAANAFNHCDTSPTPQLCEVCCKLLNKPYSVALQKWNICQTSNVNLCWFVNNISRIFHVLSATVVCHFIRLFIPDLLLKYLKLQIYEKLLNNLSHFDNSYFLSKLKMYIAFFSTSKTNYFSLVVSNCSCMKTILGEASSSSNYFS